MKNWHIIILVALVFGQAGWLLNDWVQWNISIHKIDLDKIDGK